MREQRGRGSGLGLGWVTIAGFLGAIAPRFGGENPLGGAPDPCNWHHEALSRHAAREAGWSDAAQNALAFHTDYLDSYLYNPLWWFDVTNGGGLHRTKVVLSSQHQLVNLHFDDLFSPEQVHATWQRYLSGTVAGLVWIGTGSFAPEVKASLAHNVVGASLHALQDFYSHSNWIDDATRREQTWFEVAPHARQQMDLWTGSYEEPEHLGRKFHGDFLFACTVINNLGSVGRGLLRLACHAASPLSGSALCMALRACDEARAVQVPEEWRDLVPDALETSLVFVKPGINVDSRWLAEIGAATRDVPGLTGAIAFEKAYGLAARTSVQWLQCLETLMGSAGLGAFWKDVKQLGVSTAGYKTDTAPWEDLALMPYRFISAGRYPPERGFDDTEHWYLRVTIATADVDNAGTDADIVAIVDGVRRGVLDHAPPPKQPEPDEPPHIGVMPSVLSHDDFERGSTAAYIVGPFGTRPQRLELRNDAPSAGDVVAAAFASIVKAVEDVAKGLRDFFLGLIGYHADFVDEAHTVADAASLNALAVGGRLSLELDCNGGSEGHYKVAGYIEKTASAGVTAGIPWREYVVAVTQLRCVKESEWDRASDSDEPFVLGLFIPHGGVDVTRKWRTGPYSDVDTGENRPIGESWVLRIPQTYGAISVAVAVYESDDETPKDRDELRDRFANEVDAAKAAPEQAFLVTLGEAIAAGWRPAWVEATAFRRGQTVEVCRFERLSFDRWVERGEQLSVPLIVAEDRRVLVGDTCVPAETYPWRPIEIPRLQDVDFSIPTLGRTGPRPRFDVNVPSRPPAEPDEPKEPKEPKKPKKPKKPKEPEGPDDPPRPR